MNSKKFLTHNDIMVAARSGFHFIKQLLDGRRHVNIYGVPRGGIPAMYAIMAQSDGQVFFHVVNAPLEADVIIDDIIDSGATRDRYALYGKPFYALVNKLDTKDTAWYIFPWESTEQGSAEDIVLRLLQFVGEDPKREGLKETPARFIKAWKHWTSGYKQDPAKILKVFEDGGEKMATDEMVLVRDIPIYSHCEHHLAAIFGTCHIAYIPQGGRIVGLSKLARIANMFSRRLQVQERLTTDIAECIMEHLKPMGVAVHIQARHFCMESRGVEKLGSSTITQALRGVFKDKPEARAEFMGLIK